MARKPAQKKHFSNFWLWFSLLVLLCLLAVLLFVIYKYAYLAQTPQNTSTAAASSSSTSQAEPLSVILPPSPDAGPEYIEETLFLGDSNTVRMFAYGLIPVDSFAAKPSIGIDDIANTAFIRFENDSSVYTIPQAVVKIQPRRILLTFGTNNVGGPLTLDEFILEYKDAAARLIHYYPFADIIVNSIPPIAQQNSYPKLSLHEIQKYNAALLSLCEDMGLYYVNTSDALCDAEGYLKEGFAEPDGIHLTQSALEAMLLYIRTHALDTQDIRPVINPAPARYINWEELYN